MSDTLPDETSSPLDAEAVPVPKRPGSLRRVARSAWYGLLAQAVDKLLPVLLVLYLARKLPPDTFGIYAFLLAYLAFFQVMSDYSIDTVLVRKLSQTDVDRPRVLRAGLSLKCAIGVASAAVATLAARPASAGLVPPSLALVAALTLPAGLGGAYRAYLRSTLEIRSVFLVNAGRALLLGLAVVAMVGAGAGIHGVFLAMAGVNLLTFVINSRMLAHRVPPGLTVDTAMWRELMAGVWPLFLNAMAMTLSLRIGQILLMSMRGPVEVGLFAAASRVSEAFSIVPEALMITVYPLMAGQYERASALLMQTAERSTRYLVACTGIPVILCAVDSTEVMTLLFGQSFAPSGRLLSVLAFTALLGATGSVILNLLIATHRERALYRNTLFFAAVNVVACAVLIRAYGELGAAIALLGTSAASQLALASLPATAAFVRPLLLAAARVLAAALVAVGVARWSGLGAVPATAVAFAVYLAALLVLGVLNREELNFVRTVIAGARGASRT